MSDIIYPTLDLFLYDLRDGLGENTGEIADNQAGFARKLPEQIRSLIVQRDIGVEAEYVELLGHRGREHFDSSSQKYTLKGYYYPVRLGDSYGLLLDCSVEHSLGHPERSKTEACPVSCLADLKAELDRRLADQPSTIGQVWMISGQIPNFTPDKAEAVAQACCQVPELELDWNRDFRGKSEFMGGMLFDLWRYRFKRPDNSSSSALSPILNIHQLQDNHYVLIALYPDQETAKKASQFNFDWLRLFAYRSKILWTYGQSQYLRKNLKDDFVAIKQYIKDFNQAQTRRLNLKKLRKTLVDAQNTLSNYSINLSYLNTQKRTIEVNLLNYRRRLDRIKQRLTDFQAASELEFLKQFGDNVERRYLLQVQSDYESFSPGLTLLGDLINSIRGVTEIDQAERDRNFQEIVAIFGVGLAAGALAASSAEQFPGMSDSKEVVEYPVRSALSQLGVSEAWLPPAILATVSLGITVIFALLTALVIKLSWFFRR
jgi:molecular chaperone GrpE (heat shock protein)